MDKGLLNYIVISLVVGIVVGAGVSYVAYGPQINSINLQVNEIDARLDSALSKIDSNKMESEEINAALEKEASNLQKIEARLKRIDENLDLLESESQKSTVAQNITIAQVNEKIESIKSNIQNEKTIIDVYNNVSPAVVFIISTEITFDFQLQEEVPSQGVGSGFVVSSEGYILTNNHVVEGAEIITVSFSPGEEIEAKLVGTDPATDLAVLKIDPTPDLPIAVLGDSDKVRVGMTAIAIGNPFSLERTVTVGVVSSVNRTLDAETGDIIFGVIQTDASVNPGNSGGPLVNSKSEVIGVNSAIISPVRGSVGIGFSIPINTAKKVMTQLIEKGEVSRPYLGIIGASVSGFPLELKLPEKGVLIIDVLIDSPADKAGLRGSDTEFLVGMVQYPVGGDVITGIDNTNINTLEELLEFRSKKEVGDVITLDYIRNGEKHTTQVLLEERPG